MEQKYFDILVCPVTKGRLEYRISFYSLISAIIFYGMTVSALSERTGQESLP